METNDLIKNLYINPIPDENKKYKLAKNLKVKGIPTESFHNNTPALPLITNNKGGSIIIQNWNTKNEIHPEIENINLPIIVDRLKIQNGIADIKERLEREKNKKDEFSKWRVIENGEKYLLEKGNPSIHFAAGGNRKLAKLNGLELPAPGMKNQELALKEQQQKETGIVPYEGQDQNATKKAIVVKKWNNRPIIDFSTFIKHEYLTDNEFLYCKRVGNPIEYIECVYSELVPKDKKKKGKIRPIKEYITISKNTVMHYQNGNSSVYSVVMWKDFYIKFKRLLEIPLFKNFKTAKLFDLWRRFLKKTRKTLFIEKLKKKFHHIDECLLKGFMEIRKILKEMTKVNIFKIDFKEAITINKFQEMHKVGLKELDKTIDQYRSDIKREISKACGSSYQKYKELKKITLEDNIVNKKEKKDDIEEGMNMVQKQKTQKEKLEEENQFVQNFLKDAMPYAQDATRRTHYKKLLRYIRVIDFLFNNSKYELIKKSMKLLSTKFQKMHHSNFILNTPETPMIVAFIQPFKDQIKFNPHIELIKKSLFDEFILEKIYTVIYRKSFMDPQEFQNYMVCFEEVFEVSVDQNSNLNLRIKEDNSINEIFDTIRETVGKCFEAMEIYCSELNPVLRNFNQYNSIKFEALQEDAKPEDLKDYLSKFASEGVEIAKIKPKKNMGIFEFNLENLIEMVQNAPAFWLSTMRDLIPKLLINKLKSLIQILNSYLKRLSIQVIDVETFISLKQSVKEINEDKNRIEMKNTEISDIINIIKDDAEIKIPEYDNKMIREKETLYVEFLKKHDNMFYYVENNLSKYRNELKISINRFDKEIKNMMDELNVDILNVYNEDNYSAIFYIEDKSVPIRKLIDKKEVFISQENAIEIDENSDFESLDNLVYDYELKSKLWYSVREFQDISKKWENLQVQQVNLMEMEEFIKKWSEIGETAKIDLESQNVPNALLENIKVFQQILPVLKTFQNQNISEPKFVEMIKQLLEVDFNFDYPDFTVKRLIDIPGVFEKLDEISEITKMADEENRIKLIFNEVYDSYMNSHKLPKSKFTNTKQQGEKNIDRYSITEQDFQAEYEYIEEKLIILKKLILNPYSQPIQKNITSLVNNFNKYLSFLDEFSHYQRFINAIEPVVFLNAEFAKKSSDFKKFNNENALKNCTKLIKENASLGKYIDVAHERVISDLRRGNKNYEELFKSIEDYFDNEERASFPKYYYLSNEDMLEMFAKTDNVEVKCRLMQKMLNGIKTIDLGGDTDENIKLITEDEEVIVFKYTKPKNVMKEVVEAIESEIAKKLKNAFKSYKKDFAAYSKGSNKDGISKKPKDLIIELVKNHDNLGQAIFNFVYSLYMEQLEKALNQEDAFDKIMDFHEEAKGRKESFAAALKDVNSSKVEKRILMNLISLESYFKNIIKTLVREDVVSTVDFNWQRLLHIKLDGENCTIKVFNSEIEYGYEYVGLQDNYIVSPVTERMYISLANSIDDRKPFILYGLHESGKKDTLLSFAKILGKALYTFRCSQNMDIKAFQKLLYASQKTDNWLMLDCIELINKENLSVIAQEILMVHWNIQDSKSTRIICTTGINNLNNSNILSENVKYSFRFIAQSVPDLFFIIHSSLKNLAFPKCKLYARKIKYILEYLNAKISLLKYKRIGLTLFKKLLLRLEKDVHKVNEENADNIIRRSIEKIFVPFMNEDENDDMMRTLNYIFNHSENVPFTYGSTLVSEINDIIDEVTKNTQFSNIEYRNKIKSIMSSVEDKDSYIITGPFLSGKSMALETVTKVSKILHEQNVYDNPLIRYVKIFPKSFEASYIFSEIERHSQLQIYNNFFANHLNLLKTTTIFGDDDKTKVMHQSSFNFNSPSDRVDEIQEKEPIKIVCFDGLIDPTWIEFLNFFNDKTKNQCMSTGDVIKLENHKIVFETDYLSFCTPSFITKNYVVNFNSSTIKWENMLYEFISTNKKVIVSNELKNYIRGLFENYFPKIYEFILSNKATSFNFGENYVMKNFTNLFDSILPEFDFEDKKLGRRNLNTISKIDLIKKSTLSIFIFCCAWTVNFFTNFILKTKIEKLISDIFKADDLRGPIFDYYIDEEKHIFVPWQDLLENDIKSNIEKNIELNKKINNNRFLYNKIFIPTTDNISYRWILGKYVKSNKPIFYTGKTGVGKTLLINDFLNELDSYNDEVLNLRYLINYNSSSRKMEKFLLDKLKYVKRDLIGDLYNRKVVFFVDDCNLQRSDEYNSQTCLEYMRQITNTNYIYDMKSNTIKRLDRFLLLAVGNLAAFGKNTNVDRFIHSCLLISQNSLSDESINILFKSTFETHIKQYIPNTSSITANQYIHASLNIMNWINNNFKSTPNKLHYKFGLRDISKLFQNLINFKFKLENTQFTQFLKLLWFNECMRIFEDKLFSDGDVKLFRKQLLSVYNSSLKQSIKPEGIYAKTNTIFAYEIILPAKNVNPTNSNIINSEGILNSPSQNKANANADNIANNNGNQNASENNLKNPDTNDGNSNNPESVNFDDNNMELELEHLNSNQNSNVLCCYNPREYLFWVDVQEIKNAVMAKYEEFVKNNKSRQFILNNEVFELLMKMIRAMHFNKGNILLISHSLAGKLLLFHFAAFVEGRSFYDVDETISMKDQKYFDDFFRKILLETIYKNQEVVLFLNNKMLEKDEILEILNAIVNSGEILTVFDHLKGEGEFRDVKLDDKTKIARIENNLSIVMNVFPNSIAYKKLFYNYSYISKHSTCIYLDKTSEESLFNIARDTIPELENANQKFGKFPKFLLEIHQFMIDLAQQYEEKLNFHIEIDEKNFIDMITYYENNFNNLKEHLLTQRKKYEFACDINGKLQEIISKLTEELAQLEPQMNENEKFLNEKKGELIKKLANKNNISNAKSEEEKPLNLLITNLERIQETIKENLSETERRISVCGTALTNRLEKNDLMEYKNVIEYHSLSKYLLGQIYNIVGENPEWETIKKNLDPKYLKALVAKEYNNYPLNLVKIVRETTSNPEFTTEGLPRNLSATKTICDWFIAMDNYFTEYEKQKNYFDEIEEINKKIAEIEKSINLKTENLKEVQTQISELEKSISDYDRIKMNLNLKIKNRNDLKIICDEFIVTMLDKNEFWQDKKESTNKKIENLEFYLAFLACYINYAPAFNYSFRKKIKNFFLSKSEEYGFLSIKNVNFYNIIQEFIDIKKEKDIILNLIPYDEFTKENLLLIHLSKKTPYLIDHNRISKWILKEFYDKKDNKKTISVKQGDTEMEEAIDKTMKEGFCLMIERVDSKIFDIFKNVIFDNKVHEKGKTFVSVNNQPKEINDKFKLFFIKDKIDCLIDSQMWLESLVINFIPCKELLRGTIIRELLANEGNNLWNIYMKISSEIFKDTIKLIDVEEKINQILINFDYSGSVEKNANNSGLLERLKGEYSNHTNLLAQIDTNNERLVRYQEDISKYSLIADESGKMFKLISKFTNIDNIYNFGFAVYIKFVKDFYNEKIKKENETESEYNIESLHDMIIYVYERITLIYSYPERKLLLIALVLFYYQTKGDIEKNSKYVIKLTKHIFFDGKLDTENYNEDSPLKCISKHQWNTLLEINKRSGNEILKVFIDHIKYHLEDWKNYLGSDEMILKSNFILFDLEVESSINIFQRLIFFTILKPHLFEQFIEYTKNILFPQGLIIPTMNIKKALNMTNQRKILCIVDNDSICDKEIITYYQSKHMNSETVSYTKEIIILTTDLNQVQFEKIIGLMKTGGLLILKGIQNLRSSIYKILDMLKDTRNTVNEAFRIVLVGKSNIILPNIIYDQCLILNKNNNPLDLNIKESLAELLDNIDLNVFEYMLNRKFSPVFSRKLFFHLLLAHSILKIYHNMGADMYKIPYKFDKKDFYYSFKFIKVYLEKIGDKEESANNNPNNFNNSNYLSLINVTIHTFYLNRIMFKEDYQRINKLMHRFFEEKDFLNEGYLMFYKNSQDKIFQIKNDDANLVDVLEDKYTLNEVFTSLNLDEVQSLLEKIPLDNYYDLINNLPYEIINSKMKDLAKYYIENLDKLNSVFIRSYKNMKVNMLYDVDAEKFHSIIMNIRENIPEKIYFGEEASNVIFKLTKTGEYVNPMDESIKFEVNKYNDFLVRIIEDLEIIMRIVKGEILYNDYYNQMIFDIFNGKLPNKWELHSFILKKDNNNNNINLKDWLDNIKERFFILRKWLQFGSLEVYPLKLFYNFKLFIFSILNLFSRKASVTPDEIQLKFFLTRYFSENEQELVSEKNENPGLYKNKDVIFVDGLVIENGFYNFREAKIYDNIAENKSTHISERIPIMGITYELPFIKKDQSSFDADLSIEDESIKVPIFCRDDNNNDEEFENVEPVGFIDLSYDNLYKEDYWITKGIILTSKY